MSMNLHIDFYDKKGRGVHDIDLYQTPTKITEDILKKRNSIELTEKNFNDTFLKPYFLYFNKKLTLKDFNIWWYREKTNVLNKLVQMKINNDPFYTEDKDDGLYDQIFPKYFQSKNPPKPYILFSQITLPDLYHHICYIKNSFNDYIDDYKCFLWSM